MSDLDACLSSISSPIIARRHLERIRASVSSTVETSTFRNWLRQDSNCRNVRGKGRTKKEKNLVEADSGLSSKVRVPKDSGVGILNGHISETAFQTVHDNVHSRPLTRLWRPTILNDLLQRFGHLQRNPRQTKTQTQGDGQKRTLTVGSGLLMDSGTSAGMVGRLRMEHTSVCSCFSVFTWA